MDSILINTPVSSPLHPQLNLPLLKGYLAQHGFSARVIDDNIRFFRKFLGSDCPNFSFEDYDRNPIQMLAYYNDLERLLWERSQAWEGLQIGLRSLGMKHDRLHFDSVIAALGDRASNPFVGHYEDLVKNEIGPSGARIVGIAITFQDQIIPSFTLARMIREYLPGGKIIMGGQMITRCYDSMIEHKGLCQFFDYLALWDGERTILNIHRRELRGEDVDLTNVIDMTGKSHTVDRAKAAPSALDIPRPDFSDIHFGDYLFPEMLVPLQTTRGCYANCTFCAIPFGANSYRVRKAGRVIEEILEVQDLTRKQVGRPATYFKFMEDTSSPSMLHEFSVEIEARGIDAKWETFARLEKAFTAPGFMDQLYRGGCRKIHWGLESNDPDILQGMNKKISMSHTDEVLRLSAEAGIMNFCFILVGFPGETDDMRKSLTRYIIENRHIHTLTIATFDLTRKSPMERDFRPDNPYKLDMVPARDFQVRLPYTVDGEDWKRTVVPAGHRMLIEIIKERPDIGFVTLFPDQIRSMLCDKYGNDWGRKFVERYGEQNIREILVNTEAYVNAYEGKMDIDPVVLPEPLRREHLRTKEDMALMANAVFRRREYERRRIEQI